MSDAVPSAVTVVNAAAWSARAAQLAEILGRTPPGGVVPDPAGSPSDPNRLGSVTDPAYWSGDAVALAEALREGGESSAGSSPDRSAGAVATHPDRLTLTVEEAAALLGISRAFAYEAVRRGEIPSIRIGRRVLVPRAQLARLVGDPEAGAPPP